MAHLVIVQDPRARQRLLVTACLSDAEIGRVCAEERPAAALAALLASLEGAAPAQPVIAAVASRTAWRLRCKNKRHGNRGLNIVFVMDRAAAPERLKARAAASSRIREPGCPALSDEKGPPFPAGLDPRRLRANV